MNPNPAIVSGHETTEGGAQPTDVVNPARGGMHRLDVDAVHESKMKAPELRLLVEQLRSRLEQADGMIADMNTMRGPGTIGTIVVDSTFFVQHITPALNRLLGLTPSTSAVRLEEISKKWNDAVLVDEVRRVLITGEPTENEVMNWLGHSLLRRVELRQSSVDEVKSVAIHFYDLTEPTPPTVQPEAMAGVTGVILDAIKEYAIFMIDARGKIETWSPAAEAISGFSKNHALGQNIGIIFTKEDRSGGVVAAKLQEAAREGSVMEERWHLRSDGTRFWGTGMFYAIGNSELGLNGFVVMLRDSSERKVREDNVQEALHGAERAQSAQSERLQELSHAMRTPLSALSLWTKILIDQPQLERAQVLEILKSIRECAEEQQLMIEELAHVSEPRAEKKSSAIPDRATQPLG